jgi:hypothetical protein
MSTETTTSETTTEVTLFDELEALLKSARADYDKLRGTATKAGVQDRATKLRKKLKSVQEVAQKVKKEALSLRAAAKERRAQAKATRTA